jgi:hypothetical protein
MNRFTNTEFPPYVFREYPKVVKTSEGDKEVHDREEEQALLARLLTKPAKPAA